MRRNFSPHHQLWASIFLAPKDKTQQRAGSFSNEEMDFLLLLGLLVIIAAPADLRSISLFYLFLISDVVERAPEVERETSGERSSHAKEAAQEESRRYGLTRQKQQRKIFAARAPAWDCVVK
jgi:hypothetical protein